MFDSSVYVGVKMALNDAKRQDGFKWRKTDVIW